MNVKLGRAVSSSLSGILTGVRLGIYSSARPLSSELGDHLAFTTEVNNASIHCLKVGSGPHNILLLPSIIGTATSDFMPQLTGLDRNLFTIYAWDTPGFGKSRPPNRIWTPDFLYRDAAAAAGLLKALDLKETSVIGYSFGGAIALVLTTLYPSLVNRLIVSGASAYITKEDAEMFEVFRSVKKWSPTAKKRLQEEYGDEKFQEIWDECIEAVTSYSTGKFAGNIIRNRIHEIKKQTLIFYGEKDTFISSEHPHFLLSQISGAQLVSWPEGKHDLHLTYAQDFNKVITKFLTNRCTVAKLPVSE